MLHVILVDYDQGQTRNKPGDDLKELLQYPHTLFMFCHNFPALTILVRWNVMMVPVHV
jgi:hypothetical protein